jgi:putative colanic acid biosynthesis UDP-glucose lipid carrier transferase
MVLALVLLALSFPARDRTGMPATALWAEVTAAWLARAGVIALGLWATGSLAQVDLRVLAAAWSSTVALTAVSTLAAGRLVAWWQCQPQRRRRAIVVGAGALAARVGQALRDQAGRGIDLIGCFDDRLDSRLDPAARGMRRGDLADVVDFIHRRGVQDVYITLPLGGRDAAGARIPRLLQALQDTTVSVHYVPDLLGITIIQGRLRDVNGVPVVGLCETPFTGVNQFVKRAEDLVLASLIILLISPLLLAVALGVKLSSPGPVLFRQRRNGLDGREIVVWKFRSMRTQEDGPVVKQATRDDPRITPFGAFIRRTSLDELPQFFNVLQGRMSIVGPRPHAVAHNDEYRELIRAYMVRHKVKPGITGWAQVNGHRGETDTLDKMRARVEYDLEYLHHWSLGLDLRIIARTVALVLWDRHAY